MTVVAGGADLVHPDPPAGSRWPTLATDAVSRADDHGQTTVEAVLALVWRRTLSPALRALLPHCRNAFAAGPDNGTGGGERNG